MKIQIIYLIAVLSIWGATACHKDPIAPIIPPVENPVDTTVTHPPVVVNDSTKTITITVYEVNSTIPAAGRYVVLYRVYKSDFAPPSVFDRDSLGKTDAHGVLKWEWNKKPIPESTKMGFSLYPSVDNNAFYPIPLSGTPPDQIVGAVFVPGFAKIHIQINKDSMQFKTAELVQYLPNNGWYYPVPAWSSIRTFNQSPMVDTTILVSTYAPRNEVYGVRYNYDNSYYSGYLSGSVQQQTIDFQPRDTVAVNFVVK